MGAFELPTMNRFFDWWFGELRSLVPGAGDKVNADRRTLIAVALNDKLVISVGANGERSQSIELKLTEGAGPRHADLTSAVRKLTKRSLHKVLAFSPDLILHRSLRLPAAARENVREVLGFEMDRYTPFEVDNVFYDHRVVADTPAKDGLEVDLVVIPKTAAQPYLDKLTALDIEVDYISTLDENGNLSPVRIYPEDRKRRSSRLPHMVNLVLFGLLFGSIAGSIYLDVERSNKNISQLKAKLEIAREQAQQTTAMRDRLEEMVSYMTIPLERKSSQQSMVALLNLITETLPDRTYLQRYDVRQNHLTLTGYSENASSLIDALEKTGTLANVQFVSPVTFDARVGRDRFNIRADLVMAGKQDE
jgi:general secretion pathway protein L